MLLPSVNERHLVDFFERCDALAHLGKGGVPQKRHSFFPRDALDLRSRPATDDHLADMIGQIQQFGNGAAATEARAGALQTADSFDKFDVAPNCRVKTGSAQYFRGISHFLLAMHAHHADQTLRENAIQCRNEVIGLHSHVDKTADDVGDVVGMHGRKNQVSGERGLNRNLGSFVVSNLAHHDLIRVVAKDGAQSAGKRQTLFLVHRNLRDAANLVFDGVLDRDDLVFVGLDLVNRGIESSRLSRARGAGDEHHAVRFADVSAKLPHILTRKTHHFKAEGRKLFRESLLVEHTKNRVFPVNRGHDRNAEVDETAFVPNAKTAVLRDTPLGDVQFTHDLDAGNDCGEPILGDGHHRLYQDSVNAIFDRDFDVPGLDMDVRGAPLERGENNRVHQPNDGTHGRLTCQAVCGKRRVCFLVLLDNGQRKCLSRLIEHALGLFSTLQQVADLRGGGDLQDQLLAQQQREFVTQQDLAGLGDSDYQSVALGFHGHEVEPEHQFGGNTPE